MWVIYDKPRDHPHGHIARRWITGPEKPRATDDVVIGRLELMREAFAHFGYTCLGRMEDDDPTIVETWL
jgi:hypothetical protein